MRLLSFACLCLLSVLALAWALPNLYDMALLPPLDKTHLFYSPVLRQCLYTERIRGRDTQAAALSEGHHADVVYKDEEGRYYDRRAFEAALPFIYYRNMEMRGLLPVRLKGRSLDRTAIERARRVLELPARALDGHHPPHTCLPLLEANPGQVALLYPADRFRMADGEMLFTHADTNTREEDLSTLFSDGLRSQGFLFPARHVGGNFTTFKPYEGGIFLVDARGGLFHVLRRDGRPAVRKIPLPQGVTPRHVLVSESGERHWLGLLLDMRDRLWLIRQTDFTLIGLAVPGYEPDRMDCKLLFDPLYLTVVTSDAAFARAAVFRIPATDLKNGDVCTPVHTFQHEMSRAKESWQHRLAQTLFPFRITLAREETSFLYPRWELSGHWFSRALPFSLLLTSLHALWRRRRHPGWKLTLPRCAVETSVILLTGVYGLGALLLLEEKI